MTNKSLAKAQLDGYFIYKGSRKEAVRDDDDPNLKTNLGRGDDADLYTIGARVVGTPAPVWRYRAEGAYQTGTKNGVSLRAFGFNSALMFLPKLKTSPELRLAYEFLSGDKPGTKDRNEGFDILWGRWPRWSELYIYTYAPESRISQLGNLHRFGPGLTIKPTPKAGLADRLQPALRRRDARGERLLQRPEPLPREAPDLLDPGQAQSVALGSHLGRVLLPRRLLLRGRPGRSRETGAPRHGRLPPGRADPELVGQGLGHHPPRRLVVGGTAAHCVRLVDGGRVLGYGENQ